MDEHTLVQNQERSRPSSEWVIPALVVGVVMLMLVCLLCMSVAVPVALTAVAARIQLQAIESVNLPTQRGPLPPTQNPAEIYPDRLYPRLLDSPQDYHYEMTLPALYLPGSYATDGYHVRLFAQSLASEPDDGPPRVPTDFIIYTTLVDPIVVGEPDWFYEIGMTFYDDDQDLSAEYVFRLDEARDWTISPTDSSTEALASGALITAGRAQYDWERVALVRDGAEGRVYSDSTVVGEFTFPDTSQSAAFWISIVPGYGPDPSSDLYVNYEDFVLWGLAAP